MVDQLSQLEERVEGLIELIGRTAKENEGLRKRIAKLENAAGSRNDEVAQLKGEIERLEGELQDVTGKEDVIRDRLQGILKKIDTIEQEFNVTEKAE